MAIQTSFAEKLARFQNGDHRFLALLGNDGELDLALLDVKTASATSPCEKTIPLNCGGWRSAARSGSQICNVPAPSREGEHHRRASRSPLFGPAAKAGVPPVFEPKKLVETRCGLQDIFDKSPLRPGCTFFDANYAAEPHTRITSYRHSFAVLNNQPRLAGRQFRC
jgi:hypothetical protein